MKNQPADAGFAFFKVKCTAESEYVYLRIQAITTQSKNGYPLNFYHL